MAGSGQPRVLEEILGSVPGQTRKETPNTLVMAAVKLVEGVGLPSTQGKDQLSVVIHTFS